MSDTTPASHAYGYGHLARSVTDFLEGRINRATLEREFQEINTRVDAYEKQGPAAKEQR